MSPKEPFEIDIADLGAIREAISEVTAIVEAKRETVSAAQREFAYWQTVLHRLEALSGETAPRKKQTEKKSEPSAVSEVIRLLDESAVPLRARDLRSRMPQVTAKTIAWALWKAESTGRIQRLGPGLYASLNYTPQTQEELVES